MATSVLGTLVTTMVANVAPFQKGMRGAQKQLTTTQKAAQKFGSAMAQIGAAVGLGVIAKESLQAAVNFEESVSKFNQLYGSNAEAARTWAENYANTVGRTLSDTMNGMGMFQAQLIGLRFPADQAMSMSQQLQSLSVDFASFHNLTDADAQNRFIAAMSGSGEVLDRFGVNIKSANLNLKLIELGFPEVTKGATEAQKAMARFEIIKETMGEQGALGDAVRTADSAANSMKRLQSSFAEMKVMLGTVLMPALMHYVQGLNDIIKASKEIIGINDSLKKQKDTGAATGSKATAKDLADKNALGDLLQRETVLRHDIAKAKKEQEEGGFMQAVFGTQVRDLHVWRKELEEVKAQQERLREQGITTLDQAQAARNADAVASAAEAQAAADKVRLEQIEAEAKAIADTEKERQAKLAEEKKLAALSPEERERLKEQKKQREIQEKQLALQTEANTIAERQAVALEVGADFDT